MTGSPCSLSSPIQLDEIQFLARQRLCNVCNAFGTLSEGGLLCACCYKYYHGTCVDPLRPADSWMDDLYACDECLDSDGSDASDASDASSGASSASDAEDEEDAEDTEDDDDDDDDEDMEPFTESTCTCDCCREMNEAAHTDSVYPTPVSAAINAAMQYAHDNM